jgi:hypothetical protein
LIVVSKYFFSSPGGCIFHRCPGFAFFCWVDLYVVSIFPRLRTFALGFLREDYPFGGGRCLAWKALSRTELSSFDFAYLANAARPSLQTASFVTRHSFFKFFCYITHLFPPSPDGGHY